MHIHLRLVTILIAIFWFSGCASSDYVAKDETPANEPIQQKPSEDSVTTPPNYPDIPEDSNMTEESAVLAAFEKMQQAMIDKDIDTLKTLVTEDKTFTHMSGKVQTKEEFFGEIADGTLNYYKYVINNPVVTVNGERAELTADTTLTAKVYGMSGTWTLSTHAYFIKVNNSWIQCNPF